MKRSAWIGFALWLHFLYPLFLIALCLYLFVLVGGWGAMIASIILGGPSVIALIGWLGLRKGKLWGWWVGLLSDLMLFGILTYSMIDDGRHNFDWEVAGLTLFSLAASVCLFIPTVRKFYWQSDTMQAVQFSS